MLVCGKLHIKEVTVNDDLIELNNRIAARIGLSEELVVACADFLSVCLGRLNLGSTELLELANGKAATANALDVIYINRDYLNYARMIAQAIVGAGQFAGLLVLGIDIDQARVLSRLSNSQITHVAKYAKKEVFDVIPPARRMIKFKASSRHQFVAALLAA